MTELAWPGSRLEVCARQPGDVAALRARLADRWAIVFSHPEDFAQEQMEMDRWISVLSRTFTMQHVVPVALARAGSDPRQGWLAGIAALEGGSAVVLSLDAPPGGPTELSVGTLRAQVARSGPRFAMVLDSSLRCRRTLSYRLPAELPSPLDLIGWAAALRKRDPAEGNRGGKPEAWWPVRSGWVTNARQPARAGRG